MNGISIPEHKILNIELWVVSTHAVKIWDHLNKILIFLKHPVLIKAYNNRKYKNLLSHLILSHFEKIKIVTKLNPSRKKSGMLCTKSYTETMNEPTPKK